MENVAPPPSSKPLFKAFQIADGTILTHDRSNSWEPNTSRHKEPLTSTPSIPRKRTAAPSTVSCPPKRSRRKSKSSTLQQLYLDLGQKDFGSVPCPTCGMLYQRGVEEEEQAHKAHHHRHFTTELMFPGWKNERVVRRFGENERVVVVLSSDPKYQKKRVQDVRRLVDKELGSGEGTLSWSMCFLYVTEKRVTGFVLTEKITQGYPVLTSDQVAKMLNEEDGTDEQKPPVPSQEKLQPILDSAAVYTSTTPVPAVIGIGLLWVSSNHRRKNIATRMIDCVRRSFVPGKEIPKNLVAFAQPSPDGKKFAESYCQTPNFLVWT